MWSEVDKVNFVNQFLPPDGKLLWLEEPNKRPAIITADLDGDKTHEIAAAFRWHDTNFILILKWFHGYWHPISFIPGHGYGITHLSAAPITGKEMHNLILGWQLGTVYSQLDIQEWTPKGFRSLMNEEMFFSEIEVGNMPTKDGFDDRFEIALWTHDTGKAYVIELFRWDGKKLQAFPQGYPYYFIKVAEYYRKQLIKMPDAAFYWYYLADAQVKSEQYNKALNSIEVAINLNSSYPPYSNLLDLKLDILSKLHRNQYLYPASLKTVDGTSWGYINKDGSFILKPQYDNAMDFQQNGLAIVQKDNLTGIIDRHGRYIVPPKYSSINPFNEGRASTMDSEGFKMIDESGKELTPKAYNYIGTFQNGRVIYANTAEDGLYRYGYLDGKGRDVIPAQYMNAYDFQDGYAIVQIANNQYALIDHNGEPHYTYNYYSVNNLGNGLLPFQPEANSKYGYLNIKGDIVIEPQFGMALPFADGRAVVNAADDYTSKYGLIDKSGRYIFEPIYNDIISMGENNVALGKAADPEQPFKGSIYAVADATSGTILSDFVYSSISSYDKGYASASDYNNTFFLDKTGKVAKNLPVIQGSGTLSFVGDLIKANVNQRTSYYDKSGKLVWQQNTVIPLDHQFSILEESFNPDTNYLVYYPQINGIEREDIERSVNEKLKLLSEVKPITDQLPLDYNYTGDFSVEFFKNKLLVLELSAYQYYFGAAHGMPSLVYPNINLASGQFYELKDLFKSDSNYVQVLSDIIGNQIKNDPQYEYISQDQYKGISENQHFYAKEDALYIYFAPYEIAAYAAGFPTFRVPYSEIMSIINPHGSFWQAFH